MYFFLVSRVASVFQCIFLFYFVSHRYKKLFSAGFLLALLFLLTANDFLGYFIFNENIFFWFFWTTMNTIFVLSTTMLINRYRDWRGIFTALLSTLVTQPGNIAATICYSTTGFFTGLLAESIFNVFSIFILNRSVRADYLRDQETSPKGWGILSTIPFLFYITILSLTTWPQKIYQHREAIPGTCLVLVLMFVMFIVFEITITSRREVSKEQKLDFLMQYSDRLRAESNKVSVMYQELKEHKKAMRNISNQVQNFLDSGNYEAAREFIRNIEYQIPEIEEINQTQNIVINSTIFSCEQKAANAGVHLNCNIRIPATFGEIDYEYANVVEKFVEKAISIASSSFEKRVNLAMYFAGDSQFLEIRTNLPDDLGNSSTNLEEIYLEEYKEIINQNAIASFISNYGAKCNFNSYNKSITAELTVKI